VRFFENKESGENFRANKAAVTGRWRIFHKEELKNLNFSCVIRGSKRIRKSRNVILLHMMEVRKAHEIVV
jgi:hypothetical protein